MLDGLICIKVLWASRQVREVSFRSVLAGGSSTEAIFSVSGPGPLRTLKRWDTPRFSNKSRMRGFGLSNSIAARESPLWDEPNFRPSPARTPRKVLSISGQSLKSRTKRQKPRWERPLIKVLKSTLELKLARPVILIQ